MWRTKTRSGMLANTVPKALQRAGCRKLCALAASPAGRSLRPAPAASAYELARDPQQPGADPDVSGVKSVAARDIAKGEVVFREGGTIQALPSMHTIMLAADQHVEFLGDGRFTAHSHEPNLAVQLFELVTSLVRTLALTSPR